MRGERVFARTAHQKGACQERTGDVRARSDHFPLQVFFFGVLPSHSSTMHMREGR